MVDLIIITTYAIFEWNLAQSYTGLNTRLFFQVLETVTPNVHFIVSITIFYDNKNRRVYNSMA